MSHGRSITITDHNGARLIASTDTETAEAVRFEGAGVLIDHTDLTELLEFLADAKRRHTDPNAIMNNPDACDGEGEAERAAYEPCQTARGWGECVLANGHETWESGHVGDSPMTNHVDRNGRTWGVASSRGDAQ